MSLKYTCPVCGTPLGYEGLCWKCKSEKERREVLNWTEEEVEEKQKRLIQNVRRLEEYEDPESTDFWNLLGYRDAVTPEIIIPASFITKLRRMWGRGLFQHCCPQKIQAKLPT